MGVSLQLAGVQIIELSEGSGGGISFEAEEDGYVAEDDGEQVAAGAANF